MRGGTLLQVERTGGRLRLICKQPTYFRDLLLGTKITYPSWETHPSMDIIIRG